LKEWWEHRLVTTIWAATSDGLYRIGGPDPEVALPGHSVSFMAQVGPTPQAGPEMRAIVDEHEIWGLPDGGEWAKVASLPSLRGNCLAFTDRWLIGSAEAHLFEVEDGTTVALERFDAAPGRHEWYTPWGGPPDTRSIAEWDEHVYVNVHVGGIVRTADAGTSWTPTIDIDADVHQVTTAEGALVLAACADGLAVSSDHGDSWEERADGLAHRYARGVTVVGDTVLLSTSRGPRGGEAAVYRAPLAGGAFERCTQGLPESFDGNIDSHCLDGRPAGADVAFGTEDGRVFVSEDAGSSWELAAEGLPRVRRVLVLP
jgi:hypothetical protein